MTKRILFVDDEPKVLEGLQRMLRPQRKEWEMLFVQSGAEALSALAERPFDVIVSDVRMPEMDGVQLLLQVQKHYPKMIRIVLSGYFEREAALRAAGVAHQYLAKPCDPARLHETIDNLCRSSAILTNEAAREVVSSIGSLPSPFITRASLKHHLQKPESGMEAIGRIIEQNGAITAKVLQMVNSPLLGLIFEIASVQQALGPIGLNLVKQLMLSLEIFQNFKPERSIEGFSLDDFLCHCRLTSKIVCRLPVEPALAQTAVVAALLHDAGKLVLATRLPKEFEMSLRRARDDDRCLYAVEEELIGSSHAEVGAYLLSMWGLPQAVVDAVRGHHRPSACEHTAAGVDVLAATHVADALAVEMERHVPLDEAPAASLWDLEYLNRLGVAREIPAWRRIALKIAAPVGVRSTV